MSSFYGMLGLTFKLKLSTRPDKYMGEIETWDRAETRLKEALDEFAASNAGVTWELNPGDGAFYGPKVDIAVLVCESFGEGICVVTMLTAASYRTASTYDNSPSPPH